MWVSWQQESHWCQRITINRMENKEESGDKFRSLGQVEGSGTGRRRSDRKWEARRLHRRTMSSRPRRQQTRWPKIAHGLWLQTFGWDRGRSWSNRGDKLAICCVFLQNLKGSRRETLWASEEKIIGNIMKWLFTPRRGRPLNKHTNSGPVYSCKTSFSVDFTSQTNFK